MLCGPCANSLPAGVYRPAAKLCPSCQRPICKLCADANGGKCQMCDSAYRAGQARALAHEQRVIAAFLGAP